MNAALRRPSATIGRAALVAAVLTLGAFNLGWGLGSESLTEWDESLYAHSALEMLSSGNLAATTIFGELDYFNSKPPLNVWLLATSLRVFGPSLLSLRLAAITSAWLTIVVILIWGWRRVSPVAGLFAALVLSTSFGFLQVHSGRSANPDAMLTLLLVLIVVTLDAAAARPWRRVWLGPLLAGVFLLKGMAVVLPLLLIAVIEARWRVRPRDRWVPLAIAAVLAVLPAGAWVVARWRVDRELFFGQMFFQDFIGLSTTALSNQGGSPLFYLNVLLEHQYEWLIGSGRWHPVQAGLVAIERAAPGVLAGERPFHNGRRLLDGNSCRRAIDDADKSGVVPESGVSGVCASRRRRAELRIHPDGCFSRSSGAADRGDRHGHAGR